jgi:two-component system, LytTR family, sensor histidine kinase AlgZ
MVTRKPGPESATRPSGETAKVAVPDFRNIGAVLRIIAMGNVFLFATALIRLQQWSTLMHDWLLLAGAAQVPLLVAALSMYMLGSWLPRLTWRELSVMSVCVAVLATVLAQGVGLLHGGYGAHFRQMMWATAAALLLVGYFRWRQIEQTPALDEARILALTARIRPHFFFNSLNGVLGVIRSDPRRAEQALESLAELFRELMKDNRDLVTLCDEIDLCNRYLELERLRLGDRLKVNWELKYAPLNAKVPPLMLQPLIENAVYHGIEPSAEPGTIHIGIVRKGRALEIGISNPATANVRRSTGNKMALGNIRERLALFFDFEAMLTTEERDGQYRVRIRMPLRKEDK